MGKTCGDYGGETNQGKPCERNAGAGTDHEGEGCCHDHEENMLKRHGIELSQVESLAAAGLPIDSEKGPDIKGYFGISKGTWENICQRHPEVRDSYKRGQSSASATIGQSLFQRAKNGDITAQKFYLKCQAGWKPTEGREISGPDGGPIEYDERVEIDRDKLSEEARQEIAEILADED